ncbi:group I truncated hemoglobin [Microbulbifer sp. S227A]|uniref:group I truncated hemoglobin n=1 Tax=Microbulbifer sp. S227A TaxID=3415131 RepID=UPI003C7B704A
MAQSLFEKYGGFKTVSRIIMTFYEMVLDSDQIGDHFDDVDMARLIDHQTKFVSSLMGGPASISDERLEAVHRHLGISHADFDEVVVLLRAALSAHRMAEDDILQTLDAVESKRAIIVAREAA